MRRIPNFFDLLDMPRRRNATEPPYIEFCSVVRPIRSDHVRVIQYSTCAQHSLCCGPLVATLIRSVRERLLAEDPDIAADPDLWRDTFDGESDAIDLIRNLIRASIDADPLARGHAQAPGRDRRPGRPR